MSTPKTYEVLARAFAQEQVDTCFALLGDANMNWGTALAGLGTRMIYVRHEHCAVAAAMAYARKSGKTGVATVTCGPRQAPPTTRCTTFHGCPKPFGMRSWKRG